MDRYLYLGTLYYLTSVYLRRIGALLIFFCIFLIQNTNTPIIIVINMREAYLKRDIQNKVNLGGRSRRIKKAVMEFIGLLTSSLSMFFF